MQNLSCYNEFYCMRIKNNFISMASYLALKQTLEGTRKWPIFCGMRERGKSSIVLFHIYISF